MDTPLCKFTFYLSKRGMLMNVYLICFKGRIYGFIREDVKTVLVFTLMSGFAVNSQRKPTANKTNFDYKIIIV